jgi:hypothetical protein
MALGVMAEPKGHISTIKGSLKGYKYVYIVPPSDAFFTKTLTVGTKKVVLAELAKDFYTQMGYTLLEKIDPKKEAKIMIVSFERIRLVTSSYASASGIYLQIHNARTKKMLAAYETGGYGISATEQIVHAFHNALDLFYFTLYPRVEAKILNQSGSRVELELTNETPQYIEKMKVRLLYYQGDKCVCEQEKSLRVQLVQGESIVTKVKRCKEGRNSNYTIKVKAEEDK